MQGSNLGQGAVAVGNIGYQVMGFKKQGAPIEIAVTDVVGANTVTLAPLPGREASERRKALGWLQRLNGGSGHLQQGAGQRQYHPDGQHRKRRSGIANTM